MLEAKLYTDAEMRLRPRLLYCGKDSTHPEFQEWLQADSSIVACQEDALNQFACEPEVIALEWKYLRKLCPDEQSDPVQWLREQPGLSRTRIILLTDAQKKLRAYAADEILPLPLCVMQLKSLVEAYVNQRPRVLFADATLRYRESAISTFAQLPIELTVAASGDEALHYVFSLFPQLVFLDYNLLTREGRDLVSVIREHSQAAATRIVVMAAQAGVDIVEKCLKQGVLHFVMKPYDQEELLQIAQFFLGTTTGRRTEVMVVDDSPVTINLLTDFLERERFKVTAFEDARMALAHALKNPPDLITADYSMPGMDGWEFCRELKHNRRTRDIPVVIISAGEGSYPYRKAQILRVDDYIAKPFTRNSLTYTINSVLLNRMIRRSEEGRREMERELSLGIKIQEGMLPQDNPDESGSIQVHTWWLPAKQMGGDFFEHRVISQGESLFAVADVSGKELSAAMFALAGQASLRSAMHYTTEPRKLLSGLNRFVLSTGQYDRFITCFVARYSPESRLMEYCSAGHNGMLLLRQEEVYHLSAEGFPCGMEARQEYQQKSIVIMPGDLLVLYSDGVIEATSRGGEMYSLQRFVSELQSVQTQAPEEMVNHLKKSILEFSDERSRHDDITLLIARFCA